jgi:hypothetical protein
MAITGTNGVTNFIWKGKCSKNISLRTKHCASAHISTSNGASFVPDAKPVLQSRENHPAFRCRFKNGGFSSNLFQT